MVLRLKETLAGFKLSDTELSFYEKFHPPYWFFEHLLVADPLGVVGIVEDEENPNVVIIDNMIAGNLEIEDATTLASGNTVDARILKPNFSSYQGSHFPENK